MSPDQYEPYLREMLAWVTSDSISGKLTEGAEAWDYLPADDTLRSRIGDDRLKFWVEYRNGSVAFLERRTKTASVVLEARIPRDVSEPAKARAVA